MLKNNIKKSSGFTIIEVLIVLAIAGLILLIVFLAVPALQRNSRNTQAKNAASSVLGAINEFQNNNNGQLPTAVTIDSNTGDVNATGGGGTAPATAKVQGGYSSILGNTFPATSGDTGVFTIAVNHKCIGNTGFTPASRSVAIGYLIETSGTGKAQQCVES